MVLYPRYFRQHACRLIQHLQAPVINSIATLDLPKESVFHYLPEDSALQGPPGDHWAVRLAERLVMVYHVESLSEDATEGAPRRLPIQLPLVIRDYHKRHRKLKPILNEKDFEQRLRDTRTPLVVNYALLDEIYRYTKSLYSTYYQQRNILKTYWSTVDHFITKLGRQHFLELELPIPLPSLANFRLASARLSPKLLEDFGTIEHLQLLDLWNWLGENRVESPLSRLSQASLPFVNLVIRHDQHWIWLNLGVLETWRAGLNDEEGTVSPDALQKRFLRLLVTLFESTTPTTLEPVIVTKPLPTEPEGVNPIPEVSEPAESATTIQSVLQDTATDDQLEAELDTLRERQAQKELADFKDPFTEPEAALEQGVLDRAEKLADEGFISAAEYKRYLTIAETYKTLKDPYTGKGSLVDAIKITREEVAIDTPPKLQGHPGILDPSMTEASLQQFDSRYVNTVLKKDIMASVLNLNRAGVAVTDYQVEKVEDVANAYEIHTVKLNPVIGKSSTIRFKIPTVSPEGTYTANTVKYKLRRQRCDVPLRKVAPGKVALTSYYGKIFVERSDKVVNNYAEWLTSTIRDIGLDPENPLITELKTATVVKQTLKAPRLYTILGSRFRSFTAAGIDFYFDYEKRVDHFGESNVKAVETEGRVILGLKGSVPVVVDNNQALYAVTGNELTVLGNLEGLLGLDRLKAPIETAELTIFSKSIPLGVVLAYYLGLKTLIKSLPGTVKQFLGGERLALGESEYAIRFQDVSLVVNREDRLTSLILGGFTQYKNSIKLYTFDDFNRQAVYFNVLDASGLGQRYLREFDLLKDLFIDPITLEILKEMEEPTTWLGLLRRATELLLTDYAPQEVDMEFMRIRGYERMAGAVYLQLVQSMRQYTARGNSASAVVELKPFAVWQTINGDPSVGLVEDSNPIRSINEQELTTFMGTGGRGRTSLVDRTRIFNASDVGTISEATVDGGDVAVNTYTTANPKLTSLRGLAKRFNPETDGPASLMSTAALLSPASDTDYFARVNFITIQHAQGIAAVGNAVMPLRTGYERVVSQRATGMFAATAQQDGKVTKVSGTAISVEYKDGSVQHFELGRRFGSAAGSIYPHSLKTGLKAGQAFKAGTTLIYNENFFTPDPLDPSLVLYKGGALCLTAFVEANDTFEDSSTLSVEMAKQMHTGVTHVRNLFFSFDQTVRNLISVGSEVDPEAILCTIEDAVTADNDLFSDATLDTLKLLSGNTPRAKYGGHVEKLEVFYYGDLEDMSPTLRAIAEKADAELIKQRKALGLTPVTGYMTDSIRIDKTVLEPDNLVIKVYITEDSGVGQGDKFVFGNQMKTVVARIMSGTNETESGEPLGATFSLSSAENRILTSPYVIGTTNTLLKVLSKHVAKVYFQS